MRFKIRNRHLAKLWNLILNLSQLHVPAHAGYAAYFIILAAFPALMLLLNILSYTSLSSGALVELLAGILPSALMPMITRLLESMFNSSSTTMVSVTALTTLWAASRGMYGILQGLNRMYNVQEDRGYLLTRSLSVVYTFLFLLVLLLTLALQVFGQAILARLPQTNIRLLKILWSFISNRFILLLVIQAALFTAMYMFLPNRRNDFLTSLPGAILASLGWQLFTLAFSIYVDNFSNYSTVYGSLSAVAIAMLWLYTCVSIIFYGGALNKFLNDTGTFARKKPKKS